jgi:hypothetical protein
MHLFCVKASSKNFEPSELHRDTAQLIAQSSCTMGAIDVRCVMAPPKRAQIYARPIGNIMFDRKITPFVSFLIHGPLDVQVIFSVNQKGLREQAQL